jgi:hypothetical protein
VSFPLTYPFDSTKILTKHKRLKRELLEDGSPHLSKRVAILGGSTTSDIRNCLELFLLTHGIAPEFYESEYAQYWQDSMFPNKELETFGPDVILIHTSLRNLNEYEHFAKMWERLSATYRCPIIQNNFKLPFYRLMGNREASHGKIYEITLMNLKFAEHAKIHDNFYINDNFVDGEYHIGINDIAGVPNLFGMSETGPVTQYEPKARRVTEGKFYNKVAAITTSETNSFGNSAWVIFENPDANNGTLLIYETSMWLCDNIGEQWQLTRYLAENFKRVVYTGTSTMIIPDLDSVVNPDIVIVELPERYARRGGYRDAIRVPIVADFAEIEDIPQLEESLPFKDNGIRLDSFGTQILKSDDMCELGNQDSVVLSGWAEDINSGLPLSALYLRVGDTLFQCNYGTIMRRDQLAEASYSLQYTKDTFSIEIPSKLLKK